MDHRPETRFWPYVLGILLAVGLVGGGLYYTTTTAFAERYGDCFPEPSCKRVPMPASVDDPPASCILGEVYLKKTLGTGNCVTTVNDTVCVCTAANTWKPLPASVAGQAVSVALITVLQGAGLLAAGTYSGAITTTGAITGATVTSTGAMSAGTTMAVGTNLIVGPPAAQTVATSGVVAADACGGFKAITATGAATSVTFATAAAGNAGCVMDVCNVGATNTITLLGSSFNAGGGTDKALTALDCIRVASNGTSWFQISALEAN